MIDFTKTPLPEYKGLYAVVLDHVLTKAECDDLIRAAEATTGGKWEQAMINVGGGRQRLITDTRDCGRIIWDDKAIVAKIWDRLKECVPEIQFLKGMPRVTGYGPVKRGETQVMTRLNERMRFLKYTEGQYFRPHCDGSYVTESGREISYYTLHLYLNEPGTHALGGATRFHSLSWDDKKYFDVVPQVGRVLIFQHRELLHSGDDVINGTKYTLRTDLMYSKVAEEEK
ncbi:MAG: hypothetical protein Q9216_001730 [Gyalolechia sp. 2 TL-2023]